MDGQKQVIFFNAGGLLAVRPDGKELWRIPWQTEYDVNISTPLVIGDRLFVSSGEKVGCTLFQLKKSAKPSVVWESKGAKSVMMTYWCTAVVHGKHLYGLSGEYNVPSDLACVDLASGKRVWSKPRFGMGSLALADGHLWITLKNGDLVLVPATPKGYPGKGPGQGAGERPLRHDADDCRQENVSARSEEHSLPGYRRQVGKTKLARSASEGCRQSSLALRASN